MKTLVLITLLLSSLVSLSQKKNKGIEYSNDINSLINANKIVWYGWDFSKSKLNHFSKINESEKLVNTYLPSFCHRLNEEISENKVKRRLNVEELETDLGSVQSLIRTMPKDSFVVGTGYELSIDQIKDIVKNYNLPQTSGIGFVMIIEEFDKKEDAVTGYATFFNIETREVLWAVKSKGVAKGGMYGFTNYWIEGLVDCFNISTNKYYKKSIK